MGELGVQGINMDRGTYKHGEHHGAERPASKRTGSTKTTPILSKKSSLPHNTGLFFTQLGANMQSATMSK